MPWLKQSMLSVAAAALLMPACNDRSSSSGSDEPSLAFQLTGLGNCDQAVVAVRNAAIARTRQRLQKNLENALQHARASCDSRPQPRSAPAPSSAPAAPASAQASRHSTTNNQVGGVDEPDFLKNDAGHIYLTSGGELVVVDAWPPADARVIARVQVEGTAKKLFVTENRALVYSSLGREDAGYAGYGRSQECTYGYDCAFTGDGQPLLMSLFDISDRARPRLLRRVRMSSSFVNARKIGSVVHTVVTHAGDRRFDVEKLPAWPSREFGCGGRVGERAVREAFAELERQNVDTIQSWPVEELLPRVEDSQFGAVAPQCQGYYSSPVPDGSAPTSILSFDMSASEPMSMTTVISRPGAIYASANALYLTVPHQRGRQYGWFSESSDESASSVHKFALSALPAGSIYRGSGLVAGRVLNQFSMDEYQGALRVATTVGRAPNPRTRSVLSVLTESEGGLSLVGKLGDIAPSEDIRSVRFDGARGFVVTFKKTDPLFVFDLSDPRNPRQSGELKIPGFSTYMHLLGDSHLLSIGYDTADQGEFAWFTGVLLQIFDVSDPANPRLAHRERIGTRGSSSEALTNHLAFTYYAPRRLLALPMTICEGGSQAGGYGGELTFSGMLAYDVTVESGFRTRGRVSHPPGPGINCQNWWTDGRSMVRRNVIMDDYVYSVSNDQVKVNRLDALSTDVAQVTLRP